MKRFAVVMLATLTCLGAGPSAAEPEKQDNKEKMFEKLLAEKLDIPKGVIYKKTTADDNRKAFDKLWQVFVVGDRKATEDLSDTILICGPGLWHNIKDDPEMKKLKLGVTVFQVPNINGVQVLEGKLFQGKKEVADFWKAYWRKYKPDHQAKIRRPTPGELNLYWAMISFDITEPMFMVESKDATILTQFSDKSLKLGWIDNYKEMRLKDER